VALFAQSAHSKDGYMGLVRFALRFPHTFIFNEKGLQVNGVVHLRKVKVVRDFGQQVDVDSGIRPGD
jgi:hypothetical protein